MEFYYDEALTKKVQGDSLELPDSIAGQLNEFYIYLYNEDAGDAEDISLSIGGTVSNEGVSLVLKDTNIASKTKGLATISWNPSLIDTKPLNFSLAIKYKLVFK